MDGKRGDQGDQAKCNGKSATGRRGLNSAEDMRALCILRRTFLGKNRVGRSEPDTGFKIVQASDLALSFGRPSAG